MLDKRRLYRDLFAFALLALVVFLSLALVSYSGADSVVAPLPPLHLLHQPDALVYPPSTHVHNFCGYGGALAADALFNWFGCGAYYLVISLAALDYRLLRRQEIDSLPLRLFGWLASLFGVTTLFAIA